MKLSRILLFLTVFVFFTGSLYGQNSKVVLLETFTNSFSQCPQSDDFDAAFKSTLSANGSNVIQLNFHIIDPGDPMALASIPSSDNVMRSLSGQTGSSLYILCSAVDRTNFPNYNKLTGTIPGGKTQWDDRIASELKLSSPVSITLISAQIDTISSTKSSRLIANVDVTSSQAITDSMGLFFAITQDKVPFAQCPSVPGPTIHNNVVRYVTLKDSLLDIKGKASGATSHVTYIQDISKTKADFSLANMKLIGFVEDHNAGDFTVVQSALLRSNLANLPAPPSSLVLNSSNFEGKTFAPGDPISIFFDKVSIGNVKLEYSSDNGSSWNQIDTTHDFIYQWHVPDISTTQAKIRISEASTGNPISTETGTFSIKSDKPSLTIIHPNFSDTAIAGKTFTITWNSHNADTVKISYSLDGGLNWGLIKPSLIGAKSYNWNLLGIKPVLGAEIKIEALGEAAGLVSVSDPFPIVNAVSGGVKALPEKSFLISVHPQPLRKPAQLKLNINFGSAATADISMYDLNGKKILTRDHSYFGSGDNAISIETGSLPGGTYLLEVRSDDGQVKMVKVVIE